MPRKKASVSTVPAFPGALNPELEAAVDAALDEGPPVAALTVYADWLQEQSHPLGEVLALELLDDESWNQYRKRKKSKLTDREAAVGAGRAANPELFGATLFGDDYKSPVRARWRYGVVDAIEIRTTNKKLVAKTLAAAAQLPTTRFVRTVEVSDAAAVDPAQLAIFPSLRTLTFWRGTADLAPFVGGKIKELRIAKLDKDAAAHVEAMPALADLHVQACSLARPLACKTLTSLWIGDRHHLARTLKSLDVVTELVALEWLSVEGGGMRSLESLGKLAALKSLHVAGAKTLASLDGIEKLANLEYLDASGTAVTSLAPLKKCKALRDVNLRSTKVSDLTPLYGLPELQSISAEKTKLKSIDGIAQLSKLHSLSIFDTKVEDLSPLAGLAELASLNIAGLAKATSLETLATLPKLKRLDVMAMTPKFDPELVAHAPALEDVRGCDWPPASRTAGRPLVLDAAAMQRSAVPAEVRHAALTSAPVALTVSDDGRHVAVALGYTRQSSATVVEVFSTVDGSSVHRISKHDLGPARGLCFLSDDSLLVIAGENTFALWRVAIGQPAERLGNTEAWAIFRDGPGKTVALVQNNLHSVAFCPVKTPLKPTWTYRWSEHTPHVHWGAQVRFVGDTTKAWLSGIHDEPPVLLDVAKQKVVRTLDAGAGSFAAASRDGSHVAAWLTHQFADPWLWLYRGDDVIPVEDDDFMAWNAHVVFTPDSAQLMKLGRSVQLVSLASGSVGEEVETAGRGGEHGPGVLARDAPLVAWPCFNFRDGNFRIYWAAFQPGS